MAENKRIVRNSLLKSSSSINNIQKSVINFGAGITKANTSASKIVQITSDANRFKRTLIGRDNQFFRKRREAVLRRQREDELEASTIGGVLRKQGNIVQKSTKGFLGRILDFIGVLLLGWLINTLPGIIKTVENLITNMRRVVNILGGFMDSVRDILSSVGGSLDNFNMRNKRNDFDKPRNELEEQLSQAEGGFNLLNDQIVTATQGFQEPENFGIGDTFDIELEKDESEELRQKQEQEQQKQEQEQQKDGGNLEDQSILRGIQGFGDFLTGNRFDFDKKNKQEDAQSEEGGEMDPNDNFVQVQPSFIKTEAQRNAEEQGFGNEITPEQDADAKQKISEIQETKSREGKNFVGDEVTDLAEFERELKTGLAPTQPPGENSKFAKGGKVEGKSGIDNIIGKLTAGEFIITKETTDRIGSSFFDMLNKGGKIEDIMKPNTEMVQDIQARMKRETDNISKLTTERKRSTIINVSSTGNSGSQPQPPISGGASRMIIPPIPAKTLSNLHHMLYRFT